MKKREFLKSLLTGGVGGTGLALMQPGAKAMPPPWIRLGSPGYPKPENGFHYLCVDTTKDDIPFLALKSRSGGFRMGVEQVKVTHFLPASKTGWSWKASNGYPTDDWGYQPETRSS